MTELLEEYNIEELNDRMENMLKATNAGEDVMNIESYTLLLVQYDVKEAAPQYACYYFKDGRLENREIEWGSRLIYCKDSHSFSADQRVWEWVECSAD